MKRPYSIGWFRDPLYTDGVVKVSRIFDGKWFITPYGHVGDKSPNGAGMTLTLARWKRLESIQ